MKYNLKADWEAYKEVEKFFARENRRSQSSFRRRTERELEQAPNPVLAKTIMADRKQTKKRDKLKSRTGKPLQTGYFTNVTASLDDQNQEEIQMCFFVTPVDLKKPEPRIRK